MSPNAHNTVSVPYQILQHKLFELLIIGDIMAFQIPNLKVAVKDQAENAAAGHRNTGQSLSVVITHIYFPAAHKLGPGSSLTCTSLEENYLSLDCKSLNVRS